MAAFNLNDYETVDSRIHRFHEKYPNGRIITHLLETRTNDLGQIIQYVFKAEAFRDMTDILPSATGYAEEMLGSNPVNKTSALENCETSAVGRCLANLAFSPKGLRPSQEEMGKAKRVGTPAKTSAAAPETAVDKVKASAFAKALYYGFEGAKANEFLKLLAGQDDFDLIDWKAVQLIPKDGWDEAAHKFGRTDG